LVFTNCLQKPNPSFGESRGFLDWFNENFIPEIRKFLTKQILPVKTHLVLNIVPGHPNEEQLKSADGLIQVMFMPPNCIPLIQPTDQNVILQIKAIINRVSCLTLCIKMKM